MGRLPNDGRGRLGGRPKGTPNKPQPPLSVWVADIINQNRKRIEGILSTPWTPEAVQILSALMIVGAVQGLNTSGEQTNDNAL